MKYDRRMRNSEFDDEDTFTGRIIGLSLVAVSAACMTAIVIWLVRLYTS
jgi:hypothetical protein